MNDSRSLMVCAAALAVACVAVALEWYSHVGHARTPVRAALHALPPQPSSVPSSSPGAVVYVPVTVSPTRTPGGATAVQPSSSPPSSAAATTAPLGAGTTAVPEAPAATLAPTAILPPTIRVRPDAPPRILAMSLSTPIAQSGELVSGTVETTSNVASVEARVGGYGASMQKVGVGRFQLSYRVPNLPFFFHRTFTIEVIARNSRGDAVTSSLPITVR